MMTRRVFLGMAGVAGAGLWLGVPGLAQAAVSRETKVMLGTFVDVSVAGVSSMQASDALGLAFAEASRLERVFSRHDGGTPVSELNRAGRLRAAPAELVRVVNRSLFYGALTGGSFDVTVQPVIDIFRAHRNPRAACNAAVLGQFLQDPVKAFQDTVRNRHDLALTQRSLKHGHELIPADTRYNIAASEQM